MKIKSLILTAVLVFFASQSFSETISLFGPKVYHKDKGAPVTYSESFTVPPGARNFQILVKNGTDSAGAVKNVSISLNEVEVVSTANLKGIDTAIVDVPILPENILSVTLKGQGGNAVSVQLIGQSFTSGLIPPPNGLPMPYQN